MAHTRWTRHDEILLMNCWTEVHLDTRVQNIIDDTNNTGTFWQNVLNIFNPLANNQRTKVMITGKWHQINSACQNFNTIHERVARESPNLGRQRVLQAAKAEYVATYGKEFAHEIEWRVLVVYPYWGQN